jgi:phosphohistidine phosphatase SixA
MPAHFLRPLLTALFLSFAPFVFAQTADEAKAWAALRDGGILLLRHANAPGGGDPVGFSLTDCKTQRNLDVIGQRQASGIGARFKAEKINPTTVLTSQWCRCRQTADLAFPKMRRDAIEFNSFFQNPDSAQKQTAAARKTLLNWAAKNKGTGALIVITHQVNITALTTVVPAPGEGVVVLGNGITLDVVGTIAF